ncbi:MAG: ATP-binding protein [Thermomicrobiales bacterium]
MTLPDHIMVAGSTPSLLVGREREQGILHERLAAALTGNGSLALIGGEAGVGKTALAEALCRAATEQGACVLIGRCFDLAETPAYGPWLYLFERYPQSPDVPLPPAFAVPGAIAEIASQSALFRQVLDFLKGLTARQPVVLLLDDLHWADQASLDLVRFLAQSVATLSILLLVTYRSDELTRRHPLYQLLPSLVRESAAARLDVRPLDDAAIRNLVTAQYRLADRDIGRLVAYLQGRAEGNAFFLGELLRALEETGALRADGEGWTLGDLRQTSVPQLLRQVIDARLARLDEESQRLLAVAAVIGHEVPLDVWETVAEVDEEALLVTIEHALDAHLLADLPGGERVQFAHALVREALYEGIPAVRRRRIHRRAGEALLAQSAPDADAVAYHFQQAGDSRAIEWLIQAGERALMLFADRPAAARLEAALALLDAHEPHAPERGWVLSYLASAYRFIDPPRAMSYAADALRAAERTGDRLLTMGVLRLRGWQHNDAGRVAAGLDDLLAVREMLDALTDAERATARERPYFAVPNALFDAALTEYLALCGQFGRARIGRTRRRRPAGRGGGDGGALVGDGAGHRQLLLRSDAHVHVPG